MKTSKLLANANRIPKRKRYRVPDGTPDALTLEWRRFTSFDSAWEEMPRGACLYALQSKERESQYVGQACSLRERYSSVRGLVSALMSCSNALLFVAPVAPAIVSLVEHTLIFWDATPHNRHLMQSMPVPHIRLEHTLVGVDDVPGGRYEGPGFCRPGDLRDAWSGVFKP